METRKRAQNISTQYQNSWRDISGRYYKFIHLCLFERHTIIMSLKENDVWLEEKAEAYRQAVANKEWHLLSEIEIEMEDHGFGDEVVKLSNELTAEEVAEYRVWDRKTNGDTETQMDDNS